MDKTPVMVFSGPIGEPGKWEGDVFTKKVITEGRWRHPVTNKTLDVNRDRLDQWVGVFKQCQSADIGVPTPLGHTLEPDKNAGWVVDLEVREGESCAELWASMDIQDSNINEKIGKTIKGVSVGVVRNLQDVRPDDDIRDLGEGIEHIALTNMPVVQRMGDFVLLDRNGEKVEAEVYVPDTGETVVASNSDNTDGPGYEWTFTANSSATNTVEDPKSVQDYLVEFGKLREKLLEQREKSELLEVVSGFQDMVFDAIFGFFNEDTGEFVAPKTSDDEKKKVLRGLTRDFLALLKDGQNLNKEEHGDKDKLYASTDGGQRLPTENESPQEKEETGMEMDRVAKALGAPVEEVTEDTLLARISEISEAHKEQVAELETSRDDLTGQVAALDKRTVDLTSELDLVKLGARRDFARERLTKLADRISKAEESGRMIPPQKEKLLGDFSLDFNDEGAYGDEWNAFVAEVEGKLDLIEMVPEGTMVKLSRTTVPAGLQDAAGGDDVEEDASPNKSDEDNEEAEFERRRIAAGGDAYDMSKYEKAPDGRFRLKR